MSTPCALDQQMAIDRLVFAYLRSARVDRMLVWTNRTGTSDDGKGRLAEVESMMPLSSAIAIVDTQIYAGVMDAPTTGRTPSARRSSSAGSRRFRCCGRRRWFT